MMNAKRKYISLHTYLISIQDIFAFECLHLHFPLKEREKRRFSNTCYKFISVKRDSTNSPKRPSCASNVSHFEPHTRTRVIRSFLFIVFLCALFKWICREKNKTPKHNSQIWMRLKNNRRNIVHRIARMLKSSRLTNKNNSNNNIMLMSMVMKWFYASWRCTMNNWGVRTPKFPWKIIGKHEILTLIAIHASNRFQLLLHILAGFQKWMQIVIKFRGIFVGEKQTEKSFVNTKVTETHLQITLNYIHYDIIWRNTENIFLVVI